jgi:hypothetical protein
VAISVPSFVKKWSVGEAYSILEKIDKGEDSWVIDLSDIPGGAKAFELSAISCYGVKFEIRECI